MAQTPILAVLGAGMMGGALARGFQRAGALSAANVILYDALPTAAERLAAELGPEARVAASGAEAVADAQIVLVAVKPHIVAPLLASLSPTLRNTQVIVSIAAGVPLATMEGLLAEGTPVIRVMPNTPASIGQGATALSRGRHVTDEQLEAVRGLFAAVGEAVLVEERLLNAVTGLSGSGPAYVFLIIEALADGGVKAGLPREAARRLAAQTVLGAAQMVLTSGEHPAQLKDNVVTPGGTTIAALAVLERAGVRAALIDAVEASAARSRELSGD